MHIRSAAGRYRVRLDSGLLASLAVPCPNRIILADDRFAPALAGTEAVFLKASEDNKTLAAVERVSEAMRRMGANRNTNLMVIGGGAIQDVGAFVASVYMRGINWTLVPTTLLAMVDSCIGGKSSINVTGQKNLLGTIHPPDEVVIDPAIADGLAPEQRVAGLCEAAKICFARSGRAFDRYLALVPGADASGVHLKNVVALSLASKKWFIEIDEFDRAERLLLNFGHTFGHAIEDASDFAISHGVAVGLGILVALEFTEADGTTLGPRSQMLREHVYRLLSVLPDSTHTASQLDPVRLLRAFETDKKHASGTFTVIAPDAQDRLVRGVFARNPAMEDRIVASMTAALQR